MFNMKLFCFLTLFIYSASSEDISGVIFSNSTDPTYEEGSLRAQEEIYDEYMIISLDKQPRYGNNEIFGDFVSINRTNVLQISFANINPNISFIIFQAYAHNYRITLHKNIALINSTLFGSQVGLYSDVKYKKDVFYLSNINQDVDLSVYISVHAYGPEDPIPGGCNMESSIPIAPFINIFSMVKSMMIDAAPPRDPLDPNCKKPEIYNSDSLVFYMMYTPHYDFSRETYFDAIKSMNTLDSIKKNGVIVPKTYWYTRRMVSVYPAIGVVFIAVAYRQNGYAVHVPVHTYGCLGVDDASCIENYNLLDKVFCVCIFILSTCLCFLGHRHFKSEMFVVTLLTVYTLSCSLINTQVDQPGVLFMVLLFSIGLLFASLWVLSWWIYGLPVLVVLPVALNVGLLVAAIIYYRLPNLTILQTNFNFWALFIVVALLITLTLVSVAHFGNILGCAFLGAYGIVLSVDLYIGSNLKYIIINCVRRATEPKFNYAVLMPPFQTTEKLLTVLWVLLAVSGLVFQFWYNHGRPPFPPPPRWSRANPASYGTYHDRINPRTDVTTTTRNNERTPLLA